MPWAASASIVLPSGHTRTDVINPREPKPKKGGDVKVTLKNPTADREPVFHKNVISQVAAAQLHLKHLTLCKYIRLDVSIIVLACPHKSSRRLEHLSDHIVNKPVLIPDLQLIKLRLVVPVDVQFISINVFWHLFFFFFLDKIFFQFHYNYYFFTLTFQRYPGRCL